MFIKHVPLSEIKTQAKSAVGLWRLATEKVEIEEWRAAVVSAKRVRTAMHNAGVIALVEFLDVWIQAAATDFPPRAEETDLITIELESLAAGRVEPTVQLYLPAVSEMASRASITLPDEGAFYLPALPTEGIQLPASGKFGSAIQASKDFAQALHFGLEHHTSQRTPQSLRVVRQIMVVLDNRQLDGAFGVASTLCAAWIDGVAQRDASLSEDDLSVLKNFSTWLTQCATVSATDATLVSQLAMRASKESTGRATLARKRFDLDELSSERESKFEPMANIPAFGRQWQEAITLWDEYTKNSTRPNAQAFITALKEVVTTLSPVEELAVFAHAIGKMVRKIETQGFIDAAAARLCVSSLLATLQSVYETHDLTKIKAVCRVHTAACNRMLDSGVLEVFGGAQETPVNHFFEEIAAELDKALLALQNEDVAVAIKQMESLQSYLILVEHTDSGKKFGKACKETADFLKRNPTGPAQSIVSALRQAAMVIGQNEADANTLIDNALQMQKIADDAENPEGRNRVSDCPSQENIEICEIFREEAAEIGNDQIIPLCEDALSRGSISADSGMALRRHWHTLKGSARIAGLNQLGEIAQAFEKAFERQVESGNVPIGMANASVKSFAMFSAGLDEVIACGKTTPDVAAVLRFIEEAESAQADYFETVRQVLAPLPDEIVLDLDDTNDFKDSVRGGIHPDVVKEFESECPSITETLLREVLKVQEKGVDFELVRSAHSLAGIARIVEYAALEKTASAMEQWAAYNFNAGLTPSRESSDVAVALAKQIQNIASDFANKDSKAVDFSLAEQILTHGSSEGGAESIGIQVEAEIHAAEAVEEISLHQSVPAADAPEAEPVVTYEPPPQVLETVEDIASIEAMGEITVTDEAIGVDNFDNADVLVDMQMGMVLEDIDLSEQEQFTTPDSIEELDQPETTLLGVSLDFEVSDAITDDIDTDLLVAVSQEAEELLSAMDDLVSKFEPGLSNFEEINRLLHTLKGSVRMAGMLRVGNMLHQMEDATMASITLSTKEAEHLVSKVQRGLDFVRTSMRDVLYKAPSVEKKQDQQLTAEQRSTQVVLRVDSSRLDDVSNLIGRVRITQDRVRRRVRDGFELVEGMKSPLQRLINIAKLISQEAEAQMDAGTREYASVHGFDALEMDRFTALQEYTRRMQEAVEDVDTIFQNTDDVYRDIHEALGQQVELSDGVQDAVDDISKSSLAAVEARLRAAVRQACEYTEKECSLEISGDVGIDRGVIERLVPAIEHMLRNSVAHGLESPDVRRSLGKTPTGLISISSRRDGSLASIVIKDDGMGIPFEKVRAKALSQGFTGAANATEGELVDILFSPGFTTAESVSDLAGRGVGLDAVKDTINKLGGRITLQSVSGQGVTFTVAIPLSLGYVSGMLLSSAGAPYIFPSTLVKGVDMVSGAEIAKAYQKPGALVQMADGEFKKLFTVSQLCGVESNLRISSFHQVVIPHSHPDVALIGDHLEYINNLPMKAIQSDVPLGVGVVGQVLLSDGRVAIALNPGELIKATPVDKLTQSRSDSRVHAPLILVVDDSTTVRKVSSRLLLKSGYRVETAENGAIALEKVAALRPDVILMDIEMPVMDGFETTSTLRADPATRKIPVAIISSRNAEKHRDHAQSIGATTFFGKPYSETALIEWIESVTGVAAARAEEVQG